MTVEEALNSDEFTEGQKAIIKWQFKMHGNFLTALFEAICRADPQNLARLELGFPVEVGGFKDWNNGEDFTADLVPPTNSY
jgi:hypothetical protein